MPARGLMIATAVFSIAQLQSPFLARWTAVGPMQALPASRARPHVSGQVSADPSCLRAARRRRTIPVPVGPPPTIEEGIRP